MAAIVETAQKQTRTGFAGKYKSKTHRIDMTPMVDLGFLLITFFIFTATMSTPATMNLFVPKPGPPTTVSEKGSLTIIVGKNGAISYYENILADDLSNIKASKMSDIREVIMQKKAKVVANYIFDAACENEAKTKGQNVDDCKQKNLTILIKPTPDADYNSVVSLLDEMTINRIARYALADLEGKECNIFK